MSHKRRFFHCIDKVMPSPAAVPCLGKISYGSKKDAKRAIRVLKSRGAYLASHQTLNVFSCPVCGLWHLGNAAPGKSREELRQGRLRKAEAAQSKEELGLEKAS